MKTKLLSLCMLCSSIIFGQSKNISLVKKSKEPIITANNDTLKVDQEIRIGLGSNEDGSYKYIQLLNRFNEPIEKADSRMAMKKQKISFFKIQDGTTYLFTKYVVLNIEAALLSKEVLLK
jgi:hypothetical protein